MFFLAFVICINMLFFLCVQLDPLFHILCVQKENECVPGCNDALWIHLCNRDKEIIIQPRLKGDSNENSLLEERIQAITNVAVYCAVMSFSMVRQYTEATLISF